jgi:hypothetical protein
MCIMLRSLQRYCYLAHIHFHQFDLILSFLLAYSSCTGGRVFWHLHMCLQCFLIRFTPSIIPLSFNRFNCSIFIHIDKVHQPYSSTFTLSVKIYSEQCILARCQPLCTLTFISCILTFLSLPKLEAEFTFRTKTSFMIYSIHLKLGLLIPPDFKLPSCIFRI